MPPGPKRVPAGTKKKHKFVAKAARGTLAVTAKDGKGTAIAGAAVQVEQPGGRKLNGQTTAAGTVNFPSVVAGQSKITVQKEGFKPGAATVQVPAGASVSANAVLQPATVTLAVRVIDSAGTALVGAGVAVDTPAPARLSEKTDAKGQATFKDLLVGNYQVAASLDNFTAPAAKAFAVTLKGKNTVLVTLKPNPVVAEITPTPLVVVVKKHGCSPARKQFTLKTTGPAFTGSGTGTFTCSKTNMQFFKTAAGGAKIEFKNGDDVFTAADLTKGVQLFAEGTEASKGLEDVKLKLALSVGTNKFGTPGTAKATVVELTLDLFQGRPAKAADAVPMTAVTKIDTGRFLHKQNAAHHSRAMLVVRQAPAGLGHTLEVRAVTSGTGRVAVLKKEVPAGEAAEAFPILVTKADLEGAKKVGAAKGIAFFVEGTGVSGGVPGGLRDVFLQLGIQGGEPDGDRAVFTVFEITKIDATLQNTKCKRTGLRAAASKKTSVTDNGTFAAGDPAVLKGCDDIDFVAEVKPAQTPLSWIAEQASDDTGPKKTPTVKQNAAHLEKMKVTSDAEGSFKIHAFVDQKGDATKRGPGDSGLIFRLNMVNIEVQTGAAETKVFSNDLRAGAIAGGNLVVRTGTSVSPGAGYGDATFATFGFGMKTTVKLFGGGNHRQRGIDRIGMGYIQDLVNDSVVGTYADGRTEKEVVAQLPLPGGVAVGGAVVAGPLPLLAFPVRDHKDPGSRARSPFINGSDDSDRPAQVTGALWRVRMVDSPVIAVDTLHPVTGSALASLAGSNDFHAYAVAFSSDYDENYVVVAEATWSANYGSFNAGLGGWQKTGVGIPVGGPTVHKPPEPADTHGVEHCPPAFTETFVMDAR